MTTSAVLRTEAEARRHSPLAHQRAFAAVLDTWAERAERREQPEQQDLFRGADHDQ